MPPLAPPPSAQPPPLPLSPPPLPPPPSQAQVVGVGPREFGMDTQPLWPIGSRVAVDWNGVRHDGTVMSHRMMNDKAEAAGEFQVHYDDGAVHWHKAGEWSVARAAGSSTRGVVASDEGWHRIDLRCCLSSSRLVDPARGERCTHPARCNYDALRAYAGRTCKCPVQGCDAAIPRTLDVIRVREAALERVLETVPATSDAEAMWWSPRTGEVRQEAPSGNDGMARRSDATPTPPCVVILDDGCEVLVVDDGSRVQAAEADPGRAEEAAEAAAEAEEAEEVEDAEDAEEMEEAAATATHVGGFCENSEDPSDTSRPSPFLALSTPLPVVRPPDSSTPGGANRPKKFTDEAMHVLEEAEILLRSHSVQTGDHARVLFQIAALKKRYGRSNNAAKAACSALPSAAIKFAKHRRYSLSGNARRVLTDWVDGHMADPYPSVQGARTLKAATISARVPHSPPHPTPPSLRAFPLAPLTHATR